MKNKPGCICCAFGLVSETPYGGMGVLLARADEPQINVGNSSSPPLTIMKPTGNIFDLTTIYGSGVISAGHDVDRKRLIVRDSLGTIHVLSTKGEDRGQLWSNTSDAANIGNLLWIKYHHQWGYASAIWVEDDAPLTLGVASLNSSGDFVNGPYSYVSFVTTNPYYYIANHDTDPSGNCYFEHPTLVSGYRRIRRNNTDWAKSPAQNNFSWPTSVCHTGDELLAGKSNSHINASEGSATAGIYEITGDNSTNPTQLVSVSTILGISDSFTSYTLGRNDFIYDYSRKVLNLEVFATSGDGGWRRLTVDLEKNQWMWDGTTPGSAPIITPHFVFR